LFVRRATRYPGSALRRRSINPDFLNLASTNTIKTGCRDVLNFESIRASSERETRNDAMQIPEGFERVKTGTPFVDLAGPFYFKEEGSVVAIGLLVEEKHCNSAGPAHGGLIATMADIALGNSIGHASISAEEREMWRSTGQLPRQPVPRVTVSMSCDYSGSAKLGDWIEMHVDIQRLGKSLSFANAYLDSIGGDRIARASGVYRNLG
jgi:acyl-coenzyme A thioesterase PaaI-like protein